MLLKKVLLFLDRKVKIGDLCINRGVVTLGSVIIRLVYEWRNLVSEQIYARGSFFIAGRSISPAAASAAGHVGRYASVGINRLLTDKTIQ